MSVDQSSIYDRLQEAQLSLANRQTLLSGERLRFIGLIFDFYLPISQLMPSMRGSLRALGFIFDARKLEWLGYNLVKVS